MGARLGGVFGRGKGSSWQEMMRVVLGEGGEGEEWLRRLDRLREGGGVEST